MNTIGDRIKYLRKKHKITQKQLADATGVQRGNISNYEHNRFKPNTETTIKLANYFAVSPEWLASGQENLDNNTSFDFNHSTWDKKYSIKIAREVELLLSHSKELNEKDINEIILIIRNSFKLHQELHQLQYRKGEQA